MLRRTQTVDTSGTTTTYIYDALCRLTDVTYPNAYVQTEDYDPMEPAKLETYWLGARPRAVPME